MIALFRYSERKRSERMNRTLQNKRNGAESVGNISDRDFLMFGLGLYWGEGYKESNGELGFTNSNPKVIKFYIAWLKQWGVPKTDLIFRLSLNVAFKKYEKQIKNFWVSLISVNEDQFSKTTFIKTVLRKASTDDIDKYKGILRVKVRRGLILKNKILGAIDHIATYSKI